MRIDDPNDTHDDVAADPATAAAETQDTPEGADAPEPGSQEADIAAFDKGLAEAEPEPAAADGEAEGEDGDEAGDDDKEAAAAAAKDGKADDAKKPEPNKEVEDEIAERGLKGNSADRFRELANAAKEYEPVRKALEESGISAEQLPQAMQYAKNHAEWMEIVTESTAKPEQLTDALHLIRAINSDDPEVLATAYGALEAELAAIGKRIGREAPGYDPLAEHADLADAVEKGDMTRKHAAEVAQARALRAQQDTRKQQAVQQTTEQQRAQQAQQAALTEVQQLNARLKSEDPANFAARVAQIDMAAIRQHPPHLWAAKIEAAYWRAQVAAPKPPVSGVPLRPSGNRGGLQRQPKNDMEAFEMGVAASR